MATCRQAGTHVPTRALRCRHGARDSAKMALRSPESLRLRRPIPSDTRTGENVPQRGQALHFVTHTAAIFITLPQSTRSSAHAAGSPRFIRGNSNQAGTFRYAKRLSECARAEKTSSRPGFLDIRATKSVGHNVVTKANSGCCFRRPQNTRRFLERRSNRTASHFPEAVRPCRPAALSRSVCRPA